MNTNIYYVDGKPKTLAQTVELFNATISDYTKSLEDSNTNPYAIIDFLSEEYSNFFNFLDINGPINYKLAGFTAKKEKN